MSTPSYRLKKEKRDLKKASDTPTKDSDSSTLIHPSSVTVVGAVDGQGMVQSPGSSSSAKKKKSSSSDKKSASKSSTSSEKPAKSPTTHRSSADARIDELDQKWSDRFNRLEASLLAKTMDKEPTFSTVKVTPTATAPAGIAKSTDLQICLVPTHSLLSRSPAGRPLHRPAYRAHRLWIQILTQISPTNLQ